MYGERIRLSDTILLPEIEFKEEVIKEYLLHRYNKGKPYTIIVVAEGIQIPPKKSGNKRKINTGHYITKLVNKLTGMEARETILGYIQRGGSPTAMDRILATSYLSQLTQSLKNRKIGPIVRFVYDQDIPQEMLEILKKKLKL
jgi:6-phosphofructokinase 1